MSDKKDKKQSKEDKSGTPQKEQRDTKTKDAPPSATQEQRDADSHVGEKEKVGSIDVKKAREIVLDVIGGEETEEKQEDKKEKDLSATNALFFGQKKLKENDKPKNVIIEDKEAIAEIKDISSDSDKKEKGQEIKEDHSPLFIKEKDGDTHKKEEKISEDKKREVTKEIKGAGLEDKNELVASESLFLDKKEPKKIMKDKNSNKSELPTKQEKKQDIEKELRDANKDTENDDLEKNKEKRPSLISRFRAYTKRRKEEKAKRYEKLKAQKEEKRKKKEKENKESEERKKQEREKKEKQFALKQKIKKDLKDANKETEYRDADKTPPSATQEQRDAKTKDAPPSATQEQRDADSYVGEKKKEEGASLTSKFKSYVKHKKEERTKRLEKAKKLKEEKNKKKEEVKKEIGWPQPKKEEIESSNIKDKKKKEEEKKKVNESQESLLLKINVYFKKKIDDRNKKIENLTKKIEDTRKKEVETKIEKQKEKKRLKTEKRERKDKEKAKAKKDSLILKELIKKETKKKEETKIHKRANKRKKKGKAMFHFPRGISKKLGKKSFFSTISLRNIKNTLLYVFVVAILLFVIFYSFFIILVSQFKIDNKLSRSVSRIMPVPALVTRYGIIEYYSYKDMSKRGGNKKLELIKDLIKKDTAMDYNIDTSSSGIDQRLNYAILRDHSINNYGIDKLSAINGLLNEGSSIEGVMENGNEYGGPTTFGRKEAINKFGDTISELPIGDVGAPIIHDSGYYIIKINNKNEDYFNLTYMFIDGINLDDYLDKKIVWTKIWSFVE